MARQDLPELLEKRSASVNRKDWVAPFAADRNCRALWDASAGLACARSGDELDQAGVTWGEFTDGPDPFSGTLLRRADANARSEDGRTPLLIASSWRNSSAALKLLLGRGAKPVVKSAGGVNTPLAEAAYIADETSIRTLIEGGAEMKELGCAGGIGAATAGAKRYQFARR